MGDHISLDGHHFPTTSRSSENESAPAPKRRKLRKGTQSCWECKRRKAKCIYSDHLGICDSCKRRGTDCVSQDVQENPPPLGSNKHVVDRLGEVEALVQHLLKASQTERQSQDGLASPESLGSRRKSHDDEYCSDLPTISRTNIDVGSDDTPTYIVPDTTLELEESTSLPLEGEYGDLYNELVAAWPSPNDMEAILSLPVEPSQIIRALTCAPPKDRNSGLPSPMNLLRLPPRGSHPVLVARKMLVLATYLQGVPIASEKHLDKLSLSYETIMARLVKVAHDKVTCNDDLVSSLEGIECIMLQGLYANYKGDLRRSWLAARRAVMIAQMMGLNKGVVPFSFRDVTVDVNDLWFRLINFDRYLCLMLGLPQSSPDEPLTQMEELESYPPNQKLQKLCSIACGKLLNRKTSEIYDQTIIKEVDKILRDACTSMPAQWWIMPALASHLELQDRIRETLRFNDQYMQYHLLLQLHMPYLLKEGGVENCGYHKLTAITASREIVTRFISVRTMPQTKTYCRGTDLIAFMAATALTLGHILCDHRHKRIEDNGYHFIVQQRLSDRGLLEQVLSIAENKMQSSDDDISKRLATLLHYLLAMEDNVTAGVRYSVVFVEDAMEDGGLGHRVKANNDGTELEIHLPHYPVIKILRRDPEGKEPLPALMELPWGNIPVDNRGIRGSDVRMTGSSSGVDTAGPLPLTGVHNSEGNMARDVDVPQIIPNNSDSDTWTLEGIDMSFLDAYTDGPAVI
ncbi:transcription factor [Fusarium sporotrichioides]|uniref:Transcription factor n=1 Tax=Fusarium sporotrichioides TaxID=5514 RepID=A0A395SGJ7_FUSSP|nr:transcription factor [Fusarium sporotrichioides]